MNNLVMSCTVVSFSKFATNRVEHGGTGGEIGAGITADTGCHRGWLLETVVTGDVIIVEYEDIYGHVC